MKVSQLSGRVTESGIENNTTFAWMIIESQGVQGESRSSSLMLPPTVIERVQKGEELGDAMDAIYGTSNIKQKGGAIGILTNDLLSRSTAYQQALILALIPFINQNCFKLKL